MLEEELRNYFHLNIDSREKTDGSTALSISSDWNGSLPGVKSVLVHLSGINPYTGQPIDEDKFSYEFNSISKDYDIATSKLDGTYFLKFDAVRSDGTLLQNFQEPIAVEITGKEKPYIQYEQERAKNGWIPLHLSSNCWKRCNGKLWVNAGGHTQMIPDFEGETLNCMVPSSNNQEISIIRTDRTLPEAIKRNGK